VAKRKPFGVYDLLDDPDDIAVVRYDGDPDTFTAIVWEWMARRHGEGYADQFSVEPPQPRLYRFNPSSDPDYAWQLGRPDRKGPGVFVGSLLTVRRRWDGSGARHG
jgi:hypothetical protein